MTQLPVTRKSRRICMLALMTLIAPVSAAYATDNSGSGPTTTQTSCKNTADADYRFNSKSCEENLQGNNEQMGICMQDAAADHQRALAACDKAARGAGAGSIKSGGKTLNKSN